MSVRRERVGFAYVHMYIMIHLTAPKAVSLPNHLDILRQTSFSQGFNLVYSRYSDKKGYENHLYNSIESI